MKVKKILFPFFVFLCMGIIFLFSNQNGKMSESLSDGVATRILDTVSKVTKIEVSEIKKVEIVKSTRFWVRKGAHLAVYFLLGIFVYFTLVFYNVKNPAFYAILFCFFYACSDEVHQLFVHARDGRVLDVFIDLFGSCIGIFLSYLIKRLFSKKESLNG